MFPSRRERAELGRLAADAVRRARAQRAASANAVAENGAGAYDRSQRRRPARSAGVTRRKTGLTRKESTLTCSPTADVDSSP